MFVVLLYIFIWIVF